MQHETAGGWELFVPSLPGMTWLFGWFGGYNLEGITSKILDIVHIYIDTSYIDIFCRCLIPCFNI